MSCAVAVAAAGLVLLNGVGFVAPSVPKSLTPEYRGCNQHLHVQITAGSLNIELHVRTSAAEVRFEEFRPFKYVTRTFFKKATVPQSCLWDECAG